LPFSAIGIVCAKIGTAAIAHDRRVKSTPTVQGPQAPQPQGLSQGDVGALPLTLIAGTHKQYGLHNDVREGCPYAQRDNACARDSHERTRDLAHAGSGEHARGRGRVRGSQALAATATTTARAGTTWRRWCRTLSDRDRPSSSLASPLARSGGAVSTRGSAAATGQSTHSRAPWPHVHSRFNLARRSVLEVSHRRGLVQANSCRRETPTAGGGATAGAVTRTREH
jgi:hypothetical protein